MKEKRQKRGNWKLSFFSWRKVKLERPVLSVLEIKDTLQGKGAVHGTWLTARDGLKTVISEISRLSKTSGLAKSEKISIFPLRSKMIAMYSLFFTDMVSWVWEQCCLGIASWTIADKTEKLIFLPIFFFKIVAYLGRQWKRFLLIQMFIWSHFLVKQWKKKGGAFGTCSVSS